MTVLLGVSGTGSPVWASQEDTHLRLQALEEKIEAMQKKHRMASRNPSGLDLANKVVAADSNDDYLRVKYKYPGFELKTRDGLFSTKLNWRAQLRYTNPNRSDPRSLSDFLTREDKSNFELRRVRMKIGGHGYKKWIKYYFEIDLQPSREFDDPNGNDRARVIDWRIDVQPWEELGIRVGQWKINFNRERVDSSGRQTFVERSIVNRVFTIDRQVGAMLQGRLFKETPADLRYYAGIFNGEGRATNNENGEHMYMGRAQWNFLGRDLKWRQSDVKGHDKPTGSLAFGYATNNGNCTRWSSSGCGNLAALDKATAATPDQFRIKQWVQEFAFKYKGLAIQQEYHHKEVEDKSNVLTHDYQGMYAQIGYTNHGALPVPEGLELAFRYAYLLEPRNDTQLDRNRREEYTVALNYFIAGHNNKLTVDYSYLTLDDFASGLEVSDNRIRLQWDISF
ncbi:MAG: porin [Nitrospinaceae bacterium]|nr:porin [Nitrospinaceae bacterium]NIR57048.1 porin [Nitrospinaceae bacterium]NIS87503.1 porin [Nitrospinaceae bacterium]NIT84357.1 porin [Nitrospinaceae bacterium]NIU46544.1 porin [Nitrospinaceae bacterium]